MEVVELQRQRRRTGKDSPKFERHTRTRERVRLRSINLTQLRSRNRSQRTQSDSNQVCGPESGRIAKRQQGGVSFFFGALGLFHPFSCFPSFSGSTQGTESHTCPKRAVGTEGSGRTRKRTKHLPHRSHRSPRPIEIGQILRRLQLQIGFPV